MSNAIQTTIDPAGRLVVPKPIRELAGIGPGDLLMVAYRDGRIEIEPVPRPIHIRDRGGFRVAEQAGSYETTAEPLSMKTVRRTREELRTARKGRKRR